MVLSGDHYQADGIPLTPVDDDGVWNPYQVAEITVGDTRRAVLAQTEATVPTSDEINCAKCHGANAFADILDEHEEVDGKKLTELMPVLCADCHGSPVLGQSPENRGSSGKYLSEAIHGYHKDKEPVVTTAIPEPQPSAAAAWLIRTRTGTASNATAPWPSRRPPSRPEPRFPG